MHRYLLALVASFLGMLALVFVVGSLMPQTWSVEQATTVAAPPSAVFAELSDLHRWPDWTVWREAEDLRFEFSGPPQGAGATVTWRGPGDELGRIEIRESQPPRRLVYARTDARGTTLATGEFRLETANEGTRVRWILSGDIGSNPLQRIMAPMMTGMVGGELAAGLVTLSRLVGDAEARAASTTAPAE